MKSQKKCAGVPVSFGKERKGFDLDFTHTLGLSSSENIRGVEERRRQAEDGSRKKRNLVLFKTHTRLRTIRSMHIKKKSLSFLETGQQQKNLANALPSKKENPCDTKQPLTPKQSYLSKHDLQKYILPY